MEDDIEIDMTAAQAEMDTEFGDAAGPAADSEGAAPAASPPAAPAAPAPQEPWMQYPNDLKKDYEAHWAAIPPEFKKAFHEYRDQKLKGISQYKQAYDPYAQLEQHYNPYLQQHNVSLPQVTQAMLNAHLALLYAPDEGVKQKYAEKIVKDYGLEPIFRKMYGGGSGQPAQPQAAPQELLTQVERMVQERLTPVQQELAARRAAEAKQKEEATLSEIDKFLTDPQYPHAREVLEDMTHLIAGGVASTLKDAYERAIWINPAVRAKLMDQEVAKVAKPSRPAPRNVRAGSTPPAPTSSQPEGDIEDTMRRVLQDINSR